MATVRFFAAAADIMGAEQLELEVADVHSLRELVLREYGVSADKVISRCSIMVSGIRAQSDGHAIKPEDVVDVLPPFAGG